MPPPRTPKSPRRSPRERRASVIDLRPGATRALVVLVYFVLLTLVGTVGYVVIEGWSWGDALYMTVTTETAVGFNEVHPLSPRGRYWTMFVLAGGLTGLGMWFALVTALVVRMDIGNTYRRRRTVKLAKKAEDHVIVCGGGAMGRQVVYELDGAKKPWALIERDAAVADALRRTWPDGLVVSGDATKDAVLADAGIESAAGLVSCLCLDTDNLFVCLSARHLNPGLAVVARAEGESAMAKMRRAGADHVVSPNVTGAVWIASVLARPSVASLLGDATPGPHFSRHLEQVTVGAASKLAGSTLAEAAIPGRVGLVVVAVRRAGAEPGATILNPGAATRIEAGDDLVVFGDEEQVRALRGYVA